MFVDVFIKKLRLIHIQHFAFYYNKRFILLTLTSFSIVMSCLIGKLTSNELHKNCHRLLDLRLQMWEPLARNVSSLSFYFKLSLFY